jgi:transcriptional regulator with XRE-family HTH domain
MAKSSICKHQPAPLRLSSTMDPAVRAALGGTLRRHRLARSMTQSVLGHPLTRAYVSSVEAGRTVPSLPALRLMVLRLDLSLAEFFDEVEGVLSTST